MTTFSKKSKKSLRMSEDDWAELQKKSLSSKPKTPVEVLRDLGIPEKQIKKSPRSKKVKETVESLDISTMDDAVETETAPVKKRRGVEVVPIMQSLATPSVHIHQHSATEGPVLSLWFEGARVLTVNELFAIFQYRKYETFKYKKRWKALIEEAVLQYRLTNKGQSPHYFDGPTRLVLYRRGKKYIDLDSFQTVFKYAIDGLRASKVLAEDHPLIVVDTVPVQELGAPSIGIRLERLNSWVAPEPSDIFKTWFGIPNPTLQPPELIKEVKKRRPVKLKVTKEDHEKI